MYHVYVKITFSACNAINKQNINNKEYLFIHMLVAR